MAGNSTTMSNNLFVKLPDDIQGLIWRKYFTYQVLAELDYEWWTKNMFDDYIAGKCENDDDSEEDPEDFFNSYGYYPFEEEA